MDMYFTASINVPNTFIVQKAQAIEVLVKQKAFFVKRANPYHSNTLVGHVSWAKCGGVTQAWDIAKRNAGAI